MILGNGESKVCKNGIRAAMRARRKSLSADEKARAAAVICDKLVQLPEIHDAGDGGEFICAVYLALQDEINLMGAITVLLDRGVTVAAPRWNGKAYELVKLKGLGAENLRKGPMGVLEPRGAGVVRPKDVAVWLVPGLAFTIDGRRLGYGGGWYDRLMSGANASALKLGIAYGFQIAEDLPCEPHDIRLNAVIDDSPGNC